MTTAPDIKSLHGFVNGYVQGVFFRVETQHMAQQLGLRGWVRNTPDGNVELLIHGSTASLAEMRLWLHHGPARARVISVELQTVEFDVPVGFEIIA
ncbi:MAG: acylphosphatase [Pseudohongiellaceae bacterium]